MITAGRKHTVISKRDLNVNWDSISGEVVTYILPDEELSKYRSLPVPVKQSKPIRYGP